MKSRRSASFAGAFFLLVFAATAASAAATIKLRVTAELANIRQSPSISSIIVRQIPERAILEAVRKEGEWYFVTLEPDETGNVSGYVHESLVLPLDEAPVPEKKTRAVERTEPPVSKTVEEKPAEIPPPTIPREDQTAEEPGASGEWPGISLVLAAGGIDARIGDINQGAQGLADYYAFQLGTNKRTVNEVHLALLFGAEVLVPLSPQFALSAGAEYYGASRASTVTFGSSAAITAFGATPEFRAIPVKLGLVYSPARFFYGKIGFLAAFAKAGYDYRVTYADKSTEQWTGQATATGLGFFGGLGLDLEISPRFAFIAELSAQSAKIKGFSGTDTHQKSTLAEPETQKGRLYAFVAQPHPDQSFPLVFVRDKLPTEAFVANPREASLDLTGLALKAGFKIRF